MSKQFLKYSFLLGLLLLLGNQQLFAYTLNARIPAVQKISSAQAFDDSQELISNSFSTDQRPQHVVAEEKVEEEEERTEHSDDLLRNRYLATSLAHSFSDGSPFVLAKEHVNPHPHFCYFPSYKRYLRFEVFRI